MPDIIAGKYEVIETIGRGGMGTVYKARQTNLDRIVAIKMLSEELASDPEFRARFQQEATVVARLNHPNIVQVHDIEPHNNTFCIIMEFVDGENLQAKIDRDVTASEQEVVAIGAQVSRALAYAHDRGIIHRDIKPDNIHVTPKGIAKVMDFGIARFLDSKLKTQTGISMGTPKFMSPEQVTGKNVDGQTDLYSLGICMYYCLAGKPPFDGENAISVATRHLYEQPELPSKLNSSISPAVEKVILKALEKQKANRYKTGTEMAEALDEVLESRPPIHEGLDGATAFAGATQKMPAQVYGGATPTGGARSSSPTTGHTPLGGPSVPHLDDDFKTPYAQSEPDDPTRSFRFSLFVFGALVLFAVALLVALVLWLRQSDEDVSELANPVTHLISPGPNIESVAAASRRLIDADKPAEARNLWLKFREQNPEVEPDIVNQELEKVEAQLPLSETEALAKLRFQEAFKHLNNKERALALAYLKGAEALSPSIASSAITTSTMQNLQRILSVAPSAAGAQSANQALAQARQLIKDDRMGPGTQKLMVQAIETDYADPVYWEALGDFFLQNQNIDGARVMYGEAADRTTDTARRNMLTKKLHDISR